MKVCLGDIVERFGGELKGDPSLVIQRIAPLELAQEGDLSFLANPKYRSQLKATRATAVILAAQVEDCPVPAIVVAQPYLYYAYVAQWLNPVEQTLGGIHPSAVVEGVVSASAWIGPNAYVAQGAEIAEHAIIGPNSVVFSGARIGAFSRLIANVTIGNDCVIGARCLIHPGVVIGADGFGFAREPDGQWVKIPQVGRVTIGNDVEIGAGTTIDRGALADTIIGDGVKLDNQIQIGHNVVIGEHSALAGCVGVAGSARIGRRCTVGGAAVILGHLTIADNVNISAGTLIGKSITESGTYTGTTPFQEHGLWLKNFSRLRHLDAMADKLRHLESRMSEFESREK